VKRYADKPDTNQPEIVDALRAVGAKVYIISYPLDLLVAFREIFYIIEVKSQGEKLSTSQQKTVLEMWDAGCMVHVVYDVDEALQAIGAI
jgi:hypothetical protein